MGSPVSFYSATKAKVYVTVNLYMFAYDVSRRAVNGPASRTASYRFFQ